MGLFPKSLLSDDILYTATTEDHKQESEELFTTTQDHENGEVTGALQEMNKLTLETNTMS